MGLVVVHVFYDLPAAAAAKSFLEAHGVEAFIPDLQYATNFSYQTVAIGGIRLMTLDEDAEAATALLNSAEPDSRPSEPISVRNRTLTLLGFLLTGIPNAIRPRR